MTYDTWKATDPQDEAFDEVVNPDTIEEYEDYRVNWDLFFKCKKEHEQGSK